MDNKQKALQLWRDLLDNMKKEGVLETPGVEAAFAAVPRHVFLPGLALEEAYSNKAVGLKHDTSGLLVSSSSQPSMMAIMLEQLRLKPGDNVLEIGTASGYNAAIMKFIVGEAGHITTVEIDKDLAEQAVKNLQRTKIRDVHVVHGDGANGYAPRASYDYIVSTVGIWDIPPAWISQLKPAGALVAPIVVDGVQVSARFVQQPDGTLLSTDNRPCSFVYMRGNYAGPDFRRQIGSTSLFILADEIEKMDTVALHSLLSDDHEYCQFEPSLTSNDYWFGYQLFLMVNEPDDCIFLVYSIIEGQKAYGMEGRGIALYTPGSISFAGYHEKGTVDCFGGSDAFLAMQDALDEWVTVGQPGADALRLRWIRQPVEEPHIEHGKLYRRRDNFLHAWIEF